jgi:hypothetical protein
LPLSSRLAKTFTVLWQLFSGIVLLVPIPLPVLVFAPVQLLKLIAGGEILTINHEKNPNKS